MSCYTLHTDAYLINYGYNHCLKGFWLSVYDSKKLKHLGNIFGANPLFSSISAWPGGVMEITDLIYVLKKYGEKIPSSYLQQLYWEAEIFGYFSTLNIKDFRGDPIEILSFSFSPFINFLKKLSLILRNIFRIPLSAARAFKDKN